MDNLDVNLITDLLKQKWFELAMKENYPSTPEVTAELDRLESEINKLETKTLSA